MEPVKNWHNMVLKALALSRYTSQTQTELEHNNLMPGLDNVDRH